MVDGGDSLADFCGFCLFIIFCAPIIDRLVFRGMTEDPHGPGQFATDGYLSVTYPLRIRYMSVTQPLDTYAVTL